MLQQIDSDTKDDKKATMIDILAQHCEYLKLGEVEIRNELNKDGETLEKVREALKEGEKTIQVIDETNESVAEIDLETKEVKSEEDDVKQYLHNLVKLNF